MTRRRRRSKSYAHERWLTAHYFFKIQARGCIAPAGAKSVTAVEAFRLGSHAMRIRDHALPPTQNYDTSFFFLIVCCLSLPLSLSLSITDHTRRLLHILHLALFEMSCSTKKVVIRHSS